MLNAWLQALRLKTLPLALGAILLGSRLPKMSFDVTILGFAALTAVLLQILSNLANDYGDFVKGTDKHRKDRQLGGGKISPTAMKIAIGLFVVLSLGSGILLLNAAFGFNTLRWWTFMIFGLLSIAAAIAYTVGKKAYGYYGLGDLFVFLFFGILGVLGTAYLYSSQIESSFVLAAVAYGALCVGVLNVNNIRDLDKDILNNKITLASKMGKDGALNYQAFLMITAVIALLAHHIVSGYTSLAPIGAGALGYFHILALRKAENSDDYNQQLKILSLGSLGVVLLFLIELFL